MKSSSPLSASRLPWLLALTTTVFLTWGIQTSARGATFPVTVTNDTGAGSLRQALTDANAAAGLDLITFNIATPTKTIIIASALPTITDPVVIDGGSQPGYAGAPLVELNGNAVAGAIDGLRVMAGGSVIRGLCINRFTGDGIEIVTNGNNLVVGCYIGLGLDGVTVRANSLSGIFITNSANNVIGGLDATNRNYISGNSQDGVHIGGSTSVTNTILGNRIGLDINSADKGNTRDGIRLNAPFNVIGGTLSGAQNVISGNNSDGVEILNNLSFGNRVEGNYIGTDPSGTLDLGNSGVGVLINNAPGNTIGSSTATGANLISGNNSGGIEISGTGGAFNQVFGNAIGTGASATQFLPNTGAGVVFSSNARSNVIGGVGVGQANTIWFNTTDGIQAGSGTNNTFRGNSIAYNGDLGIDLGTTGVTLNDFGDGDTGANQLQNYPLVVAVTNDAASVTIAGTLNSRSNAAFRIDFYTSQLVDMASPNGEGEFYLGFTNVTTDATSNANFLVTFATALSGRYVSATATDVQGNTSEFSPATTSVSLLAPTNFTVTTTADSGPGSLRKAILDANSFISSGTDTIGFSIAGAGVQTISPTLVLPPILDPVVVDGYTQPLATPNTLSNGFDANILIRLDGTTAGTGADGLRLLASNCVIRGLAIQRFNGDGIEISTNGNNSITGCLILSNTVQGVFLNASSGNIIGGGAPAVRNVISANANSGVRIEGATARNNAVLGNFIGTDASGTLDWGNVADGVTIVGAPANWIGGAGAGEGNVISGNNSDGVEISATTGAFNQVLGNKIGTDASGLASLGNTLSGVQITSSARTNIIGGVSAGEGNVIAFNSSDGVQVGSGTNNVIRGNSIFSNANLGIDLGSSGVLANDAGDPDAGANELQNYPVITLATNTVSGTTIGGSLNSRPSRDYTLDFYGTAAPDATGYGEGQFYLGSTAVTTDAGSNATFLVTVPGVNPFRYVTATATDTNGNTSEFSAAFTAQSTVPGVTFTVLNTNDAGPGSLRQAILDANGTVTSNNTINFTIPGTGPHTISPATALPTLTEPALIDGYSQPGSSANTLATSNNAAIQVRLDGNTTSFDGLVLGFSGCVVRGLAVVRFRDGIVITNSSCRVEGCLIGLDVDNTDKGCSSDGVFINNVPASIIGGTTPAARNVISGNNSMGVHVSGALATGNQVLGNLIGTDLTGTTNRGNSSHGIHFNAAPGNVAGGAASGARNVISGNNVGVALDGLGASNNIVQGNLVGTDWSGARALANSQHGIYVLSSANRNTIGGTAAGEANVVAFNGNIGIFVNSGSNNAVRANAVFNNANLGLDLGTAGVSANDGGDADTGANQLQNFPLLVAVTNSASGTEVRGTLNSRASTTFALDFFASIAYDASGNGEGQVYLGSTNVSTDGAGNGAFVAPLPAVTLSGRFITATATDPDGNTSEFSPAFATISTLPGSNFVVTVTNDSGPGSFREAILAANATITSGDTIQFVIAGAGPHTINLLSALPTVNDEGTTIDGYSQSGSSVNTLAMGSDAVLKIKLSGTGLPNGTRGLRLTASNCVVRGLCIVGFPSTSAHGIELLTNASACTIEGNFIGVDTDGATDLGNGGSGVYVNGVANVIIGGGTVAARNIISGNTGYGVGLLGPSGGGHQIQGNLIGTDRTGAVDVGNGNDGVNADNSANNLIGGSTASERNVISGNNSIGLNLLGSAATNNVVLGNYIGTDATGASALPNTSHGVQVTTSARYNQIGGAAPGEGNLIAYNLNDGVFVSSGTNNAIRANRTFNNTGLGIDLGANGITANDSGDGDGGANQLQNFPLLTSATANPLTTVVSGSLNSGTNQTYALDFFSNYSCDPSTNGEGQSYLGSTNVTTDGSGSVVFSVTLGATVTGRFITATATDANGNTSEFSPCLKAASTIAPVTFTVINTNDSGPGSLRQAISNNNLTVSATANTIAFAIPGAGPHTIAPLSALPALLEAAVVDGFTQTNASPNSLAAGNDAVLQIRLDGINAGSASDGLRLQGSNNVVRGLCIVRFGDNGLHLTAASNVVEGCFIGMDLDGSDLGNTLDGVFINGAGKNVIGGATPSARNVISGNNSDGIEISGTAASGNLVAGNFIGAGLDGTAGRPNSGNGILISSAPANTIGGTAIGVRNIIAANGSDGVELSGAGASNNVVQGNFIGTDVTGTVDLGNGTDGVLISSVPFNQIGGNTIGAANLISGNSSDGVTLSGSGAIGNEVKGNWIGLDASGTLALGNSGNGILITSSASGNFIGASGNVIAHNSGDGIQVASGTNNAIRHNRVFSNGDLAVDLGTTGVTTNDPGDADGGANQLQNFPVLTGATNSVSQVVIAGTLNSAPSTAFDLDFFSTQVRSANGFGDAAEYLGSGSVTTDGSGSGSFIVTLPVSLTRRYVMATATDPFGNSSEVGPVVAAASIIPATNFVVTTNADAGPGSLREAIEQANTFISQGNDTISFAIPGAGPHTIAPSGTLTILDPVTINGFTQTGALANTLCAGNNAVLRIRLSGTNAGVSTDGLRIQSFSGAVVRGLCIVGYGGDGVEITDGVGHQLEGNFIGIDTDGTTMLANGQHGVHLSVTNTAFNVIGGTTAAARNVISGNTSDGVRINNSSSNTVAGNFIGTDAAGVLDRGNQQKGIAVIGSSVSGNLIGGTSGCARNVISGNGQYSFSDHDGIYVNSARNTVIVGNFIGTDATGTVDVGNGAAGVHLLAASFSAIGGSSPAQRNVISGNTYGVEMESASVSNSVQGNFIGTDAAGLARLENVFGGVFIPGGRFNLIGGPGAGNVISGGSDGVYIAGSSSPSNSIQGNFIGTDQAGTVNLGNTSHGIRIEQSFTFVGGTNAGEGNTIAFNFGRGVTVSSSATSCPILGNSIYSNNSLGIDHNVNGVTANDVGDGDTGGNRLQNFPVLTFALTDTNTTWAVGTLSSATNATFRLEFFDNPVCDSFGYGEGRTLVGAATVTTDGNGVAAFTVFLSPPPQFGRFITATATDTNGNTSEFSACAPVVPHNAIDLSVTAADSSDPASVALGYTYQINVFNGGPTNATGVVVTDILPAGVNLVSATPSQGSCSNLGGVVTCHLGTLSYGSNAFIVLAVSPTVTDFAASNYVAVIANEFDHQLGNNSEIDYTRIGIADMVTSITDSPDPVVAGLPVTYIVTLSNAGHDTATDAAASFFMNYDGVITGQSVSQGSVQVVGNRVDGLFGIIPAGGNATLSVTLIPIATGTNDVNADGSAREFDPDTQNNYALEETSMQDGPGILEFSNPFYTVSEHQGLGFATVHRLGGAVGTVSVNFATSNLTALAGSDYTSTNGTLTFTNGETVKSIRVPIINDAAPECNEFLGLSIFNPAGGAIALRSTNATLYIFDNDTPAGGTVRGVSQTPSNLVATGESDSRSASISEDGRLVVFTSYAGNLVLDQDFNFNSDIFVHDRLLGVTRLVSLNSSGTYAGNDSSNDGIISANGQKAAFLSYARNLVTNEVTANQQLFVRDLSSGMNHLVSVSLSGTGSDNTTYEATLSSNGMRVAFRSSASDLVLNDTNETSDIFVRDLLSGTTSLVSANTTGGGPGNLASFNPTISANGEFVAFRSVASNLIPGDTNGNYDVFLRSLSAGTTTLISMNTNGGVGNHSAGSDTLCISADGRYVAFDSQAWDLVPGTLYPLQFTYLRDTVAGTTRMVSLTSSNTIPNNMSVLRGMSRDGRYVLFETTANDMVANDSNGGTDVFVRDTVANTTTLVSVNQTGTGVGNNTSADSSISPDGRFVTFSSFASNLAPGATFGNYQAFVRDLLSGTTELLSTAFGSTDGGNDLAFQSVASTNGVVVFTAYGDDLAPVDRNFNADVYSRAPGETSPTLLSRAVGVMGDDYSFDARVSMDGSKVVFASQAEDLLAGDGNFTSDIFLHDLVSGTNILVSVNSTGTGTGDGYSDVPSISQDGRYVAFYSQSADLVASDDNFFGDIFRRDTLAGVTELVSVNQAGTGPGNNNSFDPEITPDGRFIVFESRATNLVGNDLNSTQDDIFIRDMSNSVPELVSVNHLGTGSGNGYSYEPRVSDDARYVAFESSSSDLVSGDTNGFVDVFVRDRVANTNHLCSINLAGTGSGNANSFNPIISANGRVVVFNSYASDLAAGDGNFARDIFAFDTLTGTLSLVSATPGGVPGNGDSLNYSISADGRYVAFESSSSDLVGGDANGFNDVFVRDLLTGVTTLISANCNGSGSADDESYLPQISRDGRFVTFESLAWNLTGGDFSNYTQNVFRRDLLSGVTTLVSQNRLLTGGSEDSSYSPTISANGGTIAFLSSASDLVFGDNNRTDDVFAWLSGTVPSIADIIVGKSASTNQVNVGDNVIYTITVFNMGPSNATGVVLTDPVPGAMTLVNVTSSHGICTNIGNTVICNFASLAAGFGATVTITVNAASPGNTLNTVSVAGSEADPIPANNSASASVLINALTQPSLSIVSSNALFYIRWPSSASGYRLITTTNLAPPIGWTSVTNVPTNDGTWKSIILTPDPAEAARFFQLINP